VTRNPQARRLIIPQRLPQCEGKPTEGMNRPARCSNRASYDLDGHKLCGRHAGSYALRVYLGEDASDLIVTSKD
jgi:hypothetical protein